MSDDDDDDDEKKQPPPSPDVKRCKYCKITGCNKECKIKKIKFILYRKPQKLYSCIRKRI